MSTPLSSEVKHALKNVRSLDAKSYYPPACLTILVNVLNVVKMSLKTPDLPVVELKNLSLNQRSTTVAYETFFSGCELWPQP